MFMEPGEFADRSALLAAIAVQGYEILERRLREAREQAPTAVRALSALIETYVAFARDHLAHIHLMLRGELARSACCGPLVMPAPGAWC